MQSFQKAAFLFVILFSHARRADAQFFKQIINTVKQTAQNNANNKASNATNKSIDKVGGAVSGKSANNTSKSAPGENASGDTAATNTVLGAFAKAGSDNPNDTSGSDLLAKALGNLVGGAGISREDSAKAIESFRHASGGSGYVYTYNMSIHAQSSNKKDTMTLYFCGNGNARSEIGLPLPGVTKKMVIIAHAQQRRYSLMINDDTHTYALEVIDTAFMHHVNGMTNYKAVKIGTETVNGFVCDHAKLTSTTGSGLFRSTTTTDIWMSTRVPGYSVVEKLTSMGSVTPGMVYALEQAGCKGMMVRMSSENRKSSVATDLVNTRAASLPASIFEIPTGYTMSNKSMMSNMIHH